MNYNTTVNLPRVAFHCFSFQSSLLNDIFLKIRIDFLTKKLKVIQSFRRCNSKFSKHSRVLNMYEMSINNTLE